MLKPSRNGHFGNLSISNEGRGANGNRDNAVKYEFPHVPGKNGARWPLKSELTCACAICDEQKDHRLQFKRKQKLKYGRLGKLYRVLAHAAYGYANK